MKNYWHMQLHPDDLNGYSKEDILELVEKSGYIGLDINENTATNLGVNDKPFTQWGDKLDEYGAKYNTWNTQIKSFLDLKNNSIVLVRHGEKFVALVKVIGEYEFHKLDTVWFRHMYKVEILSTYKDFTKTYKIPKAQGTFQISKSGDTFKVIDEIYNETMRKKDMQQKKNLLISQKQIILQGPPGTGKTRLAKELARYIIKDEAIPKVDDIKEQVKLIQFHPSYSYEDFVRGIVAKSNGTNIEYKTEDKILAKMAKDAQNNKDKTYILIIDEINRANLSSVLGELIYALEYRDEAVESMYEVDGSREIVLPSNLYIIGTMNTADRSTGYIDYAIRRRFTFVDVLPDEDVVHLESKFAKVKEIFKEHISMEFNLDDVMLGHSYFIADSEEQLKAKFDYQVIPLLKEYIKDGVLNESAKDAINEL